MKGWLIEVIYLGGESDARGINEKWVAAFDDPQAAVAAVAEKSRGSSPKVIRRLDATELSQAGIAKAAEVTQFNSDA